MKITIRTDSAYDAKNIHEENAQSGIITDDPALKHIFELLQKNTVKKSKKHFDSSFDISLKDFKQYFHEFFYLFDSGISKIVLTTDEAENHKSKLVDVVDGYLLENKFKSDMNYDDLTNFMKLSISEKENKLADWTIVE